MNTISSKVSIKEKLGYGLGDFASNLFYMTFVYFGTYFYTDVFKLDPLAVATMFMVIRVWDAIFDVIIGSIADRTETRWGKFRPFLLWAAVPYGVIGFLTFYSPQFSDTGKLVYAYITYTVMMMVYSLINIPYSAMLGVITPDSTERTSLSSYKFIAAFTAGLLVQGATLGLVSYFGTQHDATTGAALVDATGKTIIDTAIGFRITIALYAVLAIALFFVTFAATKERVKAAVLQKTSLLSDVKDLMQNKPWILLFFMGLATIAYVSIRNGSIVYYFKYYIQDASVPIFGMVSGDKLASAFMVIGTLATILGTALIKPMVKIFGKSRLYIMLMGITTVLTVSFFFLGREHIALMFVLQVLANLFMGPTSAIVWAMYADTADYSEYQTGRKATGLIFSAAIMAQKFGWTIGGSLPGVLLAYYGFVPDAQQNPDTIMGICMMLSIIPALGSLMAGGVALFYKLNDKRMKEIELELSVRRAAADKAAGISQ